MVTPPADYVGFALNFGKAAYVSIGGDVYSEAVIVIVAQEDGAMKVRDVEFGRP